MPGAKPGVKLVFPGREKPGEAGSKAGDAGSKPGKAGNPGAGPKAGTPGISGSLCPRVSSQNSLLFFCMHRKLCMGLSDRLVKDG